MQLTNLFTLIVLATSAAASYAGHPAEGTHVASSEKFHGHKPNHHDTRDAREHHGGFKPAHAGNETENFHHEVGAAEHHEAGKNHVKDLGKRGGGVYYCTENNWKGKCSKYAADNKCHKMVNVQRGSIGPDKGVTCKLWEVSDCSGQSTTLSYPGSGSINYWLDGYATYVVHAYKCHT